MVPSKQGYILNIISYETRHEQEILNKEFYKRKTPCFFDAQYSR